VRAVELVVTVAQHEQHGIRVDAAGQQPDDVKCRLVRPVHVLDHYGRWSSRPQLSQQRHRNVEGPATAHDLFGEAIADRVGQL